MKTFSLIVALLFVCIHAYAQPCAIDGRVASGGRALAGAGIALFSEAGKEQLVTVADSNGFFCIEKIAAGNYYLRISSVGYRPYETFLTLKLQPVHLGTIPLRVMDSVLDEVVVSAAALPVVQKHDTTEYAAGAYKLSENASAVTLIRKLPGIAAQGGTVKMQGEEIMNILVDGKPFFTGDPYAVLATLPAGMIDKVQVYRDKQALEQVSGFGEKTATPVINLVIKENRKHSVFGNAYAGAGTQGRYLSGVTANSFSGDSRASAILEANNIHAQHYTADQLPGSADNTMLRTEQAALNYTNKWRKLELATTYSYTKNTASLETRQQRAYTQVADSGLAYYGLDKRTAVTGGHNFTMTLDYHADSLNSLQVRPQIAYQQNKTIADITGIMYRHGLETATVITHNDAAITTSSWGADAVYQHKGHKAGRSLILGAGYRQNEYESGLLQTVQDHTAADSLYQQTGSHITERMVNVNAAAAWPLGKAGQVQLQYEMNHKRAQSDRYNDASPDPVQPGVPPQAVVYSGFTAASLTQKAGVFYRLRKTNTDVSLGLFAQYATQQLQQRQPAVFDAARSYRNIVPVLSAQYYVTQAQSIQLMYMANAALPDLSQLQPVADNTNPMLLYMGNTALQQVYQHNLSIRYSGTSAGRQASYFIVLSGCYAQHYISNSIFFADRDTVLNGGVLLRKGAQLLQPVNTDGYTYLNLTAGYGFPLWKLHIDASVTGNQVRVPVMMNGMISKVQREGIGADISVSSNISSAIDITLSSSNAGNIVSGNAAGGQLFYTNSSNLLLNLNLPAGFTVNAGISYRLTKAPGGGNSDDALLCNLGLGRQLWKERAQLRLLVYDCLAQNKNISQFVTDTYTEQVWRNAMERYVMLAFSCNFHRYR